MANQTKTRAKYSTAVDVVATEITEFFDDFEVQLAMPKEDNLLWGVSRKRQETVCYQLQAPIDSRKINPRESVPCGIGFTFGQRTG